MAKSIHIENNGDNNGDDEIDQAEKEEIAQVMKIFFLF